MRVLLDRADHALRIRRERAKTGTASNKPESGMEGLIDTTQQMSLNQQGHKVGVSAAGGSSGDEWEVLDSSGVASGVERDDDSAIRVDQYLVVFLKFAATLIPTVEHDFTTGI